MNTSDQVTSVVRDWRRHAAVQAVAALRGIERFEAAGQVCPGSATAALKAAASPASTTGWGQQLVGPSADAWLFLRALRRKSAAAALFERALKVALAGKGAVSLPRPGAGLGAPAWVAEGGPMPVRQGALAFDTLGTPKKLAMIVPLSGELAELAGGAAEQVIGDLALDALALGLDAGLFSTAAASALRPAGLLEGVTPLTPAAAGLAARDLALADAAALAGAVSTGGGGAEILFFAAPAPALVLAAALGREVIAAPSLASGTVVAVDVGAIAWAGAFPPALETARDAVIHLEDTAPLAIGTVDTPANTVAATVVSNFQTLTYCLRVIQRINWVRRSANAVAYLTGANW